MIQPSIESSRSILLVVFLMLLCKASFSQDFEWASGYGGHTGDRVYDTSIDSQGNSLIASGNTVLKFNPTGELMWTRTIGVSSSYVLKIERNSLDEIIISGTTKGGFTIDGFSISVSHGGWRVFVAKLSADGEVLWLEGLNQLPLIHGTSNLAVDNNDQVYIGTRIEGGLTVQGTAISPGANEGGAADILIVQFDNNGTMTKYDVYGNETYESISEMSVDDDGIYFYGRSLGEITIGGQTLVLEEDNENFLVKIDHSGNLIWSKKLPTRLFGSIGLNNTTAMTINNEGEVFLARRWQEEVNEPASMELSKFSSNGQTLYSYYLSMYPNYGFDMVTVNSDLYLSFGNSDSFTLEDLTALGASQPELFLMKFNEIGFPQWIINARGSDLEVSRNIVQSEGALYVAGEYESGTLRLGDQFIYNNSGNGNSDIFLAKLNDNQTETICPDQTTLDVSILPVFCSGDYPVTFNTKYLSSVQWYLDNEPLPYDNHTSIPIDQTGTYRIEVNNGSRCPLDPFEFTVSGFEDTAGAHRIKEKPVAEINAPVLINSNQKYSFSTPYDEAYEYDWSFSSGIVISDIDSSQVTVVWEAPEELVSVDLKVTDTESGCYSEDQYQFQIETILKAAETSDIIVYPNPTSSSFQIAENHEVIGLKDATGKEVELRLLGNQYQMDRLKSGLYFLSVKAKNESQTKVIKLIKL